MKATVQHDPDATLHLDGFSKLEIIKLCRTHPYWLAQCVDFAQDKDDLMKALEATYGRGLQPTTIEYPHPAPLMMFTAKDVDVTLCVGGILSIATSETEEFFELPTI